MPLVVVVAFALNAVSGGSGGGSSASPGVLPAINASAPPNAASQSAACTKVLEALPVRLGTLTPRVVHTTPETPFVVAWGDPAVVLRCGAARPADLHADSGAQFILAGTSEAGPYYDVTKSRDGNVFTSVDRAAYVSVTIPTKYQGSDIMPPISAAIAKALPAVCSTDNTQPVATLCTRRK